MEKTLLNYPKNRTVYEHLADSEYYIFVQKNIFLLDVPHYHDSLEFVFLLKGKATVHLNGIPYQLEAGDISLSNSNVVHFYENYDNEKLAIIVVLSKKYLHNFAEIYKNATIPPILTDKQYNKQIFNLVEMWFNDQDRTILADCAYANLLLDRITRFYNLNYSSPDDANNALAIQFLDYIEKNYDKNISLDSAAKHFGYSRIYFSKKFKQILNTTFLSYVNVIRAKKAFELINDPQNKMTVMEICESCGFNNPPALYRHLKKIGYSPSKKDKFEEEAQQ